LGVHIPDMTRHGWFPGLPDARAIAVGWLEPVHAYAQGPVTREFAERLCDLLVDPWQIAVSMGRHACGFCCLTGGPATIHYQGRSVAIGNGEVLVPGESVVFVAPSSIIHYIDAHEYRPPDEFVEAVLRCPAMRSMEYFKQLRRLVPGLALTGGRVRARDE
jgi:hypothetical protein